MAATHLDPKGRPVELNAELWAYWETRGYVRLTGLPSPGTPGGGSVTWDSVAEKPDVFPPDQHQHGLEDVLTLTDTLDDLQEQIGRRPDPAAKKAVPHQVTGGFPTNGPGGTISTSGNTQGTVRYPVKFAAPVTRFRVHIRNYSYPSAAGFTGAVNLTGLWWGRARYNADGNLDGGYLNTPAQINGAATLDGTTEWVSSWITVDALEGSEYLLSLGWTIPGTGGAANLYGNWGRNWRSTASADASATAPTLTGFGAGGLFDVWLECEIPAATPVVAFVGDSITVGNMFESSYPLRYGQTHRVWPVVFGHVGAGLSDWRTNDARWTHFGPVGADAVILMCGINDIGADATYLDLRLRAFDVIARIRANVGTRVFVSTVLPSNGGNTSGGREAIRGQYNTWLLNQFRVGVAGTVDLARAVASPTDPAVLVAAYTSDGLHLSESGSVQVAAAIPHLTRG